jgi:nucleoside-diphosphate-sugar epimerase
MRILIVGVTGTIGRVVAETLSAVSTDLRGTE